MPPSRRGLLQAAGSAAVAGIAGCSTICEVGTGPGPQSETSSPGQEPTGGSSTPALTADDISFEFSVLNQPTAEHPARIQARVTNESKRFLHVSMGYYSFLTEYVGAHRERSAEMILYPPGAVLATTATATRSNPEPGTPQSPANGCWQLESTFPVPSLLRMYELAPGGAHDQEFVAYASHENHGCLPPGGYQFQGELSFGKAGSTEADDFHENGIDVSLTVTVLVDAEGSIERIDHQAMT